MVDAILANYSPVDESVSSEKIQTIRSKLLEQPEKRRFDSQFISINSAINARIRKVYNINEGIDLKVSKAIDDLPHIIKAVEENGVRYIKIRTNNTNTYNFFRYEGILTEEEIIDAFGNDALMDDAKKSTKKGIVVWSIIWGILLLGAIIIIERLTSNGGVFLWLIKNWYAAK